MFLRNIRLSSWLWTGHLSNTSRASLKNTSLYLMLYYIFLLIFERIHAEILC